MTRALVKNALWFVAGIVLALAASFLIEMQPESARSVSKDMDLEQGLDALADAIRDAGSFVRGHAWYGSEQEQAEAHRHVVRVLIGALEGKAMMDPDFPYFREINTRTKAGMDNPDQRYLIAMLRGEGSYRVWGTRGSSRRLDFTLYGEDDLAPSIATLETDDLQVDTQGSFEVTIGGPEKATNWLPSRPGPVRLLVRQIHSDWEHEEPGQLHIDRVDSGRPAYPTLSREEMARRLRVATDQFALSVRRWPEMSRTRIEALLPANQLMAPRDTGSEGGLSGRLMVVGHYQLADDEALIVSTWPSPAAYQGIQLGHHWWESMDYANRQSSLTTDQARLSDDGAYHFVISSRDPGFHNWLDTEGFERGVIMLRYDGMPVPELPEAEHPVARLVRFDEIGKKLPAGEPRIGRSEREAAVARRRRHVQRRFGF
ncbi:MAG: hypothetical protein CL910_14800 [Deltaproteobacteria bacterium]|jgi:hypothetical protein|nr:hypothetical protein [Deltaproteobacteria bacterium]